MSEFYITQIKRTILQYTELSETESLELVSILRETTERDVIFLSKLFSNDPRWISKIYGTYKAKERAISTNDMRAWNLIIKEEITQIKEYMLSPL